VTNKELLLASLEVAVPLRAAELSLTPLSKLLADGPALARTIAGSGDVLEFRGAREGATGEVFNAFARAVAILSFLPGGVTVCGVKMQNMHPDDRR
jgi:hypothetical protein